MAIVHLSPSKSMRVASRLAAMSFAVAMLAACGGSGGRGANPTPSASQSPKVSTASSAGRKVNSSPTVPPGFVCADASGGSTSVGSRVTAVRADQHGDQGYDRFIIEFDGAIPGFTVKRQDNAIFMQSPKGDTVTLAGDHGVRVTIQPVTDWASYSGSTAFGAIGTFIRQAKQVQNYEAVQQWGIGVQGNPCVHVSTLTAPSRLVIDIAAA